MREKLKIRNNKRMKFLAFFEKTGIKAGYKGPEITILLLNLQDEKGEILTDHVWMNFSKSFSKISIKQGDLIIFNARVKSYTKGYREEDFKIDYRLTYPSKVKIIGEKYPRKNVKEIKEEKTIELKQEKNNLNIISTKASNKKFLFKRLEDFIT